MTIEIWQVDAFTDRAFAGNPAGVCILPEARDTRWYQLVAAEMNLSETAFLHPKDDGFELRWFTPLTEVDLCGHATLASAHLLWERGLLSPGDQARFETRSGLLTADRDEASRWIYLDFPSTPPAACDPPHDFARTLGTQPLWVGASEYDLVVEVLDGHAVRNLDPDMNALARLPYRGIIVTANGEGESGNPDFVSRFFGPACGVPEDPVTGSAHCALGPFWGGRLGKTKMVACQLSRRGGVVRVELAGNRVRLGGQAVTILHAVLLAGPGVADTGEA